MGKCKFELKLDFDENYQLLLTDYIRELMGK